MSHIHFTAAQEYKKRVIQLGEQPENVFNVGAIGIDNIKKLKLLSKCQIEDKIKFKFAKKNLLVTFHPVTLEKSTSEQQFAHLLNALKQLNETNIIFTKTNADTDGRIINCLIDDYVSENHYTARSFKSLGQLKYLSVMQYVDAVVGNSSSGLLEAPSLKIGTINIGDRQEGRIKASSIIDCNPTESDITEALTKLYSKEFQRSLKHVINPFGNGRVSEKITKIIENIEINKNLKKQFYDIH